jgi:hypothetical protein
MRSHATRGNEGARLVWKDADPSRKLNGTARAADFAEAIHGEKCTRLTCPSARLLRCKNRNTARYAPVFAP